MTGNYLTLLEESLRKKLQVMAEIREYNRRQQEIFESGQVDMDKFDEYVEQKGVLVDKVTALDDGFEKLYANVAEELRGSREKYAEQIKTLQTLVTQVTDANVAIQAEEARNKKLIEEYFSKAKDGIRMGRQSSKAAINYYKSMRNPNLATPMFMDKKK